MLTDRITCDIQIEAPPERVWMVLTEPRFVSRWYAFGGAELDLCPFGTLVFRWKEHGAFNGLIATVEPPWALTFVYACLNPGERPRFGNSTLVELTLEPEGHRTRLRVAESGFAQLHAADAMKELLAASGRRAWTNGLGRLRSIAEHAVPARREA